MIMLNKTVIFKAVNAQNIADKYFSSVLIF